MENPLYNCKTVHIEQLLEFPFIGMDYEQEFHFSDAAKLFVKLLKKRFKENKKSHTA